VAGSFDYNPDGDDAPLTDLATPIIACRYDSSQPSGQRYTYLPNVWVQQWQKKEGNKPPAAQFSYVLHDTDFDGSGDDPEDSDEFPDYPAQFEETWPIASAPNNYKVVAGDELVILAIDPEGNYRVKWHGFAKVPQTDLEGNSQEVTFTGASVHERLWDDVIKGRTQRNADQPSTPGDPTDPTTFPVLVDLPTRFNADDHPNCTPDDTDETYTDENGNVFQYPVFLDPTLTVSSIDPTTGATVYKPVATRWTLGKLCRYLLGIYNQAQTYVDNPDFSVLDLLLHNRSPKPGVEIMDPTDPDTYVSEPIVVRDYDGTNKPFMDCMIELLEMEGFRLRLVTEGMPSTGDEFTFAPVVIEEPYDYLEIYRFDADGPTDPKECWLPVTRSPIDVDECNVNSFHAVNDFHSLANQWTVETRLNRYEISVVLAPGFEPSTADATATGMRKFLKASLDDAAIGIRQQYRYYVADELGEGHWDFTSAAMVEDAFDFSPVFPPLSDPGSTPVPTYVKRHRPGLRTLFSKDLAGKVREAELSLSRDYAGEYPAIWDGTGTWQTIDGGYTLLRDRLGIDITVEDVNAWGIGRPSPLSVGILQEPTGTLQGIVSIANPNPAVQRQKLFFLRLTCVIESDQCIDATAYVRLASPYRFTVERRVDAKDFFIRNVIDGSSAFFTASGGIAGTPLYETDDTKRATTHAEQMRAAHEFPPLAASINIPWLSEIYDVGDRLRIMSGRDVDFQVNAGTEQGEAPSYPFVVAVTHLNAAKGQSTICQLSDRRMEPRHGAARHATGY
jgi:hypothetical protein